MTANVAELDATAQAELVRAGEASPSELIEAAIRRVEAVNPAINAVIATRFERALAEAADPALPDGPFRGVPFLLKDVGAQAAGEQWHAGMTVLRDHGFRSRRDSAYWSAMRAAGCVLIGKTNTPELGLQATTEPVAYGATRNPWDTDRSAGGSSGGAAAAVAARLVPAAHANDGGGSIRIPASVCGLVGLKPSRGRVSWAPAVWYPPAQGGAVEHVVSVSVRDSAAMLDVLSTPVAGDPYSLPRPAEPFTAVLAEEPAALRIGVLRRSPEGAQDLHPECLAAVDATATLLGELGHVVTDEHPPDLVRADLIELFLKLWSVDAAADLRMIGMLLGRELGPDDVEPLTWGLAVEGAALSAVDLVLLRERVGHLVHRVAAWWANGFDLLLTPVLTCPPFRLGELVGDADAMAQQMARVPFTPTYNLSGQPAISVPLHWNGDGLPIGVQLVAAHGREDLLLALSAQLERAHPWAQRSPPIHA